MGRELHVTLTINGQPMAVTAPAPPPRGRLDETLPTLRALDDAVIAAAVEADAAPGRRVSCSKGCSTCCEIQPVPVTPPEAYALARLVEALPEPRRSAVRATFAAAVSRMAEAGLLATYLERDRDLTRDEAVDATRRYFALRIACPFLVDRACGIYAERPFVCRQYLVTTPPELCADPLEAPVRMVPMPLRFASAMLTAGRQALSAAQHVVPLVLSLLLAERRAAELEREVDGYRVVDTVMRHLAE